jgi:hypothetical protein
VDVLVLVPGLEGGRQDGVPYYGFGGWGGRVTGGVDGLNVKKDLFRVPVVEAREVWSHELAVLLYS